MKLRNLVVALCLSCTPVATYAQAPKASTPATRPAAKPNKPKLLSGRALVSKWANLAQIKTYEESYASAAAYRNNDVKKAREVGFKRDLGIATWLEEHNADARTADMMWSAAPTVGMTREQLRLMCSLFEVEATEHESVYMVIPYHWSSGEERGVLGVGQSGTTIAVRDDKVVRVRR